MRALIRDHLKPRHLSRIVPTNVNYRVDIHGAYAGGRYRFMQRYRSGFPETLDEEFDAAFARIDLIAADDPEPLPGLGPLSVALSSFADFFFIDEDLVAAAAERPADPLSEEAASAEAVRAAIEDMGGEAKTALLVRVAAGDPHVAAELKVKARERLAAGSAAPAVAPRTAGELRARALAKRGVSAWREVEAEIVTGNAASDGRALDLMCDLKVIADDAGAIEDVLARVEDIRRRHARRTGLIKRLSALE